MALANREGSRLARAFLQNQAGALPGAAYVLLARCPISDTINRAKKI